MHIVGKLRRICDRLERHERCRQKELATRLINIPNFVKEMLNDTKAILNEPEQDDNDTWNVEVSEYTYQQLIRERLGTESKKT